MKRLCFVLLSFGILSAAFEPSSVFAQERVKDAAQKLADLCSLTKSDVLGLKFSETLFTDAASPFQAYSADGKPLETQPFEFQTFAAFEGAKGFISIPGVVEGEGRSLSKEAYEKIVSLMKKLERLHEVGGPSIERVARVQQKDGSIRIGFFIAKPNGKIPSTLFSATLKPSAKVAEATKVTDSLVALVDAHWMPLDFNPSAILVGDVSKEDAKAVRKLGAVAGVSPWNLKLVRKSELPDLSPPKEGTERKPGNDLATAKRVRAGLEASIATAESLKGIMNQNGKFIRALACGRAITAMQAAIDGMNIPEEKAKSKDGGDDLLVGTKRR